ncbi:porin family protein [Bacteroidales bacterium OttesenSCG-928-M06]|nr:porin family protein [Bacteroidales bacterium OttesenSCG-928-M06]
MKKTILLISFFTCFVLAIHAQTQTVVNTESPSFQIHAGVVLPMGDFGSGDIKKNSIDGKQGFAGTGFNVGAKYYHPIASAKNLSLIFGLDIYYNGLNSDMKDWKDEMENDDTEVKLPAYMNIPLTAGVNYSYPINPNFDIYGEAVIGLNYSKMTKVKIETEEEYYGEYYSLEEETQYDPAFGFTFGLEAGILINKKYSISVRYNNLGSYNYKGKVTYTENGEEESEKFNKAFDKKKSISNVTIALGINF